MGRTKRAKRPFSPDSKKRCNNFGSGHSWFDQSQEGLDIYAVDANDISSDEEQNECVDSTNVIKSEETEEIRTASSKKIKIDTSCVESDAKPSKAIFDIDELKKKLFLCCSTLL